MRPLSGFSTYDLDDAPEAPNEVLIDDHADRPSVLPADGVEVAQALALWVGAEDTSALKRARALAQALSSGPSRIIRSTA